MRHAARASGPHDRRGRSRYPRRVRAWRWGACCVSSSAGAGSRVPPDAFRVPDREGRGSDRRGPRARLRRKPRGRSGGARASPTARRRPVPRTEDVRRVPRRASPPRCTNPTRTGAFQRAPAPAPCNRPCRECALLRADSRPRRAAAPKDRAAALDAIRTAASKRTDGVTGEKRRRHYEHAAMLVGCCVEADLQASAAWLDALRARSRPFREVLVIGERSLWSALGPLPEQPCVLLGRKLAVLSLSLDDDPHALP